jgi:F-type H+-transporting ATPase subunit delta
MAELTTVARPYAQAIFELASDANALKAWSETLDLMQAVASDASMSAAIESPSLTIAQLADLFIHVCGEHIDANARNIIKLLAENRRLQLLPEIAALYEVMRADAENIVEATVIAAHPVSDEQRDKIANALKTRLGRDVNVHCEIDESLLGGAIIRAGDTVIDGSLRGKLAKFAHALS